MFAQLNIFRIQRGKGTELLSIYAREKHPYLCELSFEEVFKLYISYAVNKHTRHAIGRHVDALNLVQETCFYIGKESHLDKKYVFDAAIVRQQWRAMMS